MAEQDAWEQFMCGERDWLWWAYTALHAAGGGVIAIQLIWGPR